MLGVQHLDRILRGDHRRDVGAIRLVPVIVVNILLAAAYGACMGFFGLFARGEEWEYRQVIACVAKVPSMLGLSILVTFPSLYVFNTLLGSRLTLGELARLLAATMGILVAVLAGFGPIVAFFSVTTVSYPFAVIMNVVAFGIAALIGVGQLDRTLTAAFTSPDDPAQNRSQLRTTRSLFAVWTILFAMVGTQMSWVLRPFIGSPDIAFSWFRPRDGSFIEAVARSMRMLMGT